MHIYLYIARRVSYGGHENRPHIVPFLPLRAMEPLNLNFFNLCCDLNS